VSERAPDTSESRVSALANLATITKADRKTGTALTQTVASLSMQLVSHDTDIKHLKKEPSCQAGDQATHETHKAYTTKNDNYFWTHGYQVGADHTNTLSDKAQRGHKKDATKDSIMGGSIWGLDA
jgi:hypothetical protein